MSRCFPSAEPGPIFGSDCLHSHKLEQSRNSLSLRLALESSLMNAFLKKNTFKAKTTIRSLKKKGEIKRWLNLKLNRYVCRPAWCEVASNYENQFTGLHKQWKPTFRLGGEPLLTAYALQTEHRDSLNAHAWKASALLTQSAAWKGETMAETQTFSSSRWSIWWQWRRRKPQLEL